MGCGVSKDGSQQVYRRESVARVGGDDEFGDGAHTRACNRGQIGAMRQSAANNTENCWDWMAGDIHMPEEEDPLALKGRRLTAAEQRARTKALKSKTGNEAMRRLQRGGDFWRCDGAGGSA